MDTPIKNITLADAIKLVADRYVTTPGLRTFYGDRERAIRAVAGELVAEKIIPPDMALAAADGALKVITRGAP